MNILEALIMMDERNPTYPINAPEVPQELKNGLKHYRPPGQAEFDVLDIVVDVEDETKTPLVVVHMPYWSVTRKPRTGELMATFNSGVNVLGLDGGNQSNVFPVSQYKLFEGESQPIVPERIRRWIEERM